jgi:hypothetical protein
MAMIVSGGLLLSMPALYLPGGMLARTPAGSWSLLYQSRAG